MFFPEQRIVQQELGITGNYPSLIRKPLERETAFTIEI
jgi:hypothetical protein